MIVWSGFMLTTISMQEYQDSSVHLYEAGSEIV